MKYILAALALVICSHVAWAEETSTWYCVIEKVVEVNTIADSRTFMIIQHNPTDSLVEPRFTMQISKDEVVTVRRNDLAKVEKLFGGKLTERVKEAHEPKTIRYENAI